MLDLLRDCFCEVSVRILCLTECITCLEVVFQVIFCSFTYLRWTLVCACHSDVEDYAECTKEYRSLAYNVPYPTCVPPSRCKRVQTPAHTGHNKSLYISQLALGSLNYSMEDNFFNKTLSILSIL